MSDGSKIERDRALKALAGLVEAIDLPQPVILGSLRRGVQLVGDIELFYPMPGSVEASGRDVVFEALDVAFPDRGHPDAGKAGAAGLFAAEMNGAGVKWGYRVKGLKPGFRYAQVVLFFGNEPRAKIPIDVFRYDTGPLGNRGWIEMIRTGPDYFGRWMLGQWLRTRGPGPKETPASKDGYPLDAEGQRVPVPTEADAFRICGLEFIAPHRRHQYGLRPVGAIR